MSDYILICLRTIHILFLNEELLVNFSTEF